MSARRAEIADALRGVGVLPIIGCEYSTQQGHLLIYGIDVPAKAYGMYPDMQAVIDDVNALGGCCITPHPYKGYSKALRKDVEKIRGLVAVESLNGQIELGYNVDDNRKARASAQRMGIPRTGASDAHRAENIGVTFTEFDGAIPDEKTFLAALRSGKFRAMRNDEVFKKRKASSEMFNAYRREDSRQLMLPAAPDPRSYYPVPTMWNRNTERFWNRYGDDDAMPLDPDDFDRPPPRTYRDRADELEEIVVKRPATAPRDRRAEMRAREAMDSLTPAERMLVENALGADWSLDEIEERNLAFLDEYERKLGER